MGISIANLGGCSHAGQTATVSPGVIEEASYGALLSELGDDPPFVIQCGEGEIEISRGTEIMCTLTVMGEDTEESVVQVTVGLINDGIPTTTAQIAP